MKKIMESTSTLIITILMTLCVIIVVLIIFNFTKMDIGKKSISSESNWKAGIASGSSKTSVDEPTTEEINKIINSDLIKTGIIMLGIIIIMFIILFFRYKYKIEKLKFSQKNLKPTLITN
ncbi:hypothetical protein J4466_04025 [Candidatus Pacearchaeota archaeon]|nr:hypothetical protein [Candidatus Pacearchaeota archaeon]